MPETRANHPALAMLDVLDVPRGMQALDALVKEAEVSVLSAGTVQNGHYLVLFAGPVEPVQRAHDHAIDVADRALFDAMLLPWADERIAPAILDGEQHASDRGDTVGVMQVDACPTLVRALDAALKGALVDLVQVRIGDGLHGRALATLRGETHDVEAALELGEHTARTGCYQGWSAVVIRNADGAVERFGGGTFHQEWRG